MGDRDRERQTLFLPGDWDPAGFFDRVAARAGGFFGVAFRGTRAATGAAAATRLRGRLGLVLSRGSAIVSVGMNYYTDECSEATRPRDLNDYLYGAQQLVG